jgi:hypothetical protein
MRTAIKESKNRIFVARSFGAHSRVPPSLQCRDVNRKSNRGIVSAELRISIERLCERVSFLH